MTRLVTRLLDKVWKYFLLLTDKTDIEVIRHYTVLSEGITRMNALVFNWFSCPDKKKTDFLNVTKSTQA